MFCEEKLLPRLLFIIPHNLSTVCDTLCEQSDSIGKTLDHIATEALRGKTFISLKVLRKIILASFTCT